MPRYQLSVFVPPGRNPHHPEGGWFVTAKDSDISRLQGLIDMGVRNGNDSSRYKIERVAQPPAEPMPNGQNEGGIES